MTCDFIDRRKEMGHPLRVVNVWSPIGWKMEVFKLDYAFKFTHEYAPALESAIEEVEYEEREDRDEEEPSRFFGGYRSDSD